MDKEAIRFSHAIFNRHPAKLPLLVALCSAMAAVSLSSTSLEANGFGENRPWQFNTANQRIANSNTADLVERKKGGFYDSFQINNTYNTSTDIQGDQINCNQQAVTTGNDGALVADSVSSSPTTNSQADISASSLGNESGSEIHTGSGGSDSGGNSGSSDSARLASVSQEARDSQQSSSVNDSNIASRVESVSVSGGTNKQTLNNHQTNQNSQLQSAIESSTGCSFTRPVAQGASL